MHACIVAIVVVRIKMAKDFFLKKYHNERVMTVNVSRINTGLDQSKDKKDVDIERFCGGGVHLQVSVHK